ncbi:MAG: hypothetical protein ACXWLS_06455 [Myxococcaceae bacterium]
MTTISDAARTLSRTRDRHKKSFLQRVLDLVLEIRSTAGEGMEVTVARSVDEAFAAFARDVRR